MQQLQRLVAPCNQMLTCNCAGKEYEQRLRQQHSKLNPRTTWALLKKKAKQRVAEGSDDEEG
jgi:hypothetical protein